MNIIERERTFEITITDKERKELIGAFQPYNQSDTAKNFKELLEKMNIY